MVVGVVRGLGPAGVTQRVWVRCDHRENSVAAEACEDCPRCTSMTFGPGGNAQAVHCRPTPPLNKSLRGRALRLPRLSVADLMTRNVLCLRPDLPLAAAWEAFASPEHGVMPVTSEEGLLLGLAHRGDLAQRVGEPDACVADVLQRVDCAVLESVSAAQAAGIMLTEGMDRLIVVNPDGEVVGVLSASAILAWVARADGYVVPLPAKDRSGAG